MTSGSPACAARIMLLDPELHYLDNAATTMVDPEIAGAIHEALLKDWANPSSPVSYTHLIGCGKCETRCPYNLPIRDMLKKVAQDFGE